ncbi:unnamed protein product, partial [Aphanomyces euteiches]
LLPAWEDIAAELKGSPLFKINKKSTALKTRFDTLMSKFKTGDIASQRKSGTSEEYEERLLLLTDIKSRLDDYADCEDARRDARKRKAEGIETSGVLLRRMAVGELDSQGAQTSNKQKKRKSLPPRIDVGDLIGSTQAGVEEKRRRDDDQANLARERLEFDHSQSKLLAEQFAAQQRAMLDLVGALLKKIE